MGGCRGREALAVTLQAGEEGGDPLGEGEYVTACLDSEAVVTNQRNVHDLLDFCSCEVGSPPSEGLP